MKLNKEFILKKVTQNRRRLRHYGVKHLDLFGSFAREQGRKTSDLDFVVEFEKKSFDAYMDTKIFLEELFNHKVDLVMRNMIKPRLKPVIEKEAVHVPGL